MALRADVFNLIDAHVTDLQAEAENGRRSAAHIEDDLDRLREVIQLRARQRNLFDALQTQVAHLRASIAQQLATLGDLRREMRRLRGPRGRARPDVRTGAGAEL
jgi:predicted RNase H-like nuclease (RuvC/YqgF family)